MIKTGKDIIDLIAPKIKAMPAGTLVWLTIAAFLYLWLMVYNLKLWLLVNVGAVTIAFWQAILKSASPVKINDEDLKSHKDEIKKDPVTQTVKTTPRTT